MLLSRKFSDIQSVEWERRGQRGDFELTVHYHQKFWQKIMGVPATSKTWVRIGCWWFTTDERVVLSPFALKEIITVMSYILNQKKQDS